MCGPQHKCRYVHNVCFSSCIRATCLSGRQKPASSSQRVKREGESELKVSFSLRSDDRVTVSDGPWRGGRVAVRRV